MMDFAFKAREVSSTRGALSYLVRRIGLAEQWRLYAYIIIALADGNWSLSLLRLCSQVGASMDLTRPVPAKLDSLNHHPGLLLLHRHILWLRCQMAS
jgi:hypothetical protein